MYQKMRVEGSTVVVERGRAEERHEFETPDEASATLRTVAECLTWVGTPFRDCCDVRGPQGGVDCAMLLVRSFVDSGRLAPFDPRPYSNQWHMHQGKEEFVDWIETRLRGQRVDAPRLGDVIVYKFGRVFSHGALVVNSEEIVHAFKKSEICHVSLMRETDLMFQRSGRPRPQIYYRVTR